MKNKKYLYAIIVVAAAIAVMLGIYSANRPDITEGSKSVSVTVIDDEGKESQYFANTQAKFLKQVLDELSEQDFAYSGEEGQYGLYIDTVNGVTVDNISAYWGFYVNGEYCNYGVEKQPVADGDAFEIVYEEMK